MWSRIQETPADAFRSEQGSALIVVIILTALLAGVASLTLQTGSHADRSSARGMNSDRALAVAEAGVGEAMAKVTATGGTFSGQVSGVMPRGAYSGAVTRSGDGYVIEVTGRAGGPQLGRSRTVRVTLGPPAAIRYALRSNTSVELKNLDVVDGDIWANDSVLLDQNNTIAGSVTAAQGWVHMKQGSRVKGDVWTGGFHSGTWALRLENNAIIERGAKASVSDLMTTCPTGGDYGISLGQGARIEGAVTTCDTASGGSIGGPYVPNTYTQAAVPMPIPEFTFNPNNYDPSGYREFSDVASFQSWLASNKDALQGTLYVHEPAPSQTARIDLAGATVVGDTTIVTNAPIFTGDVSDGTGTERLFVLVSRYRPPTGAACSVDRDSSECAVHVKNNFSPSCATAVLIYAGRGPVAIKNNQKACGSVVADSILVKNNQELAYDERVARIVGFGAPTYEIVRWEEVPS